LYFNQRKNKYSEMLLLIHILCNSIVVDITYLITKIHFNLGMTKITEDEASNGIYTYM